MDDLTITTSGGLTVSGWDEIRVTRGIERVPSDFEISLTERYPGEVGNLIINPGDACTVSLGADLVLTGYVDRYMPSYSPTDHRVRLAGRSKCCDLVDCSAEWPSGQISADTPLGIASKLAAPYGISVSTLSGAGPVLQQFNLNPGETPFEIIERISRFSALLAYDGTDGNLILARAGSTAMASGFAEGSNVQSAIVSYTQDQRYSQYVVILQSAYTLGDLGTSGFQEWTAADAGVARNRKRIIIAEAGQGGQLLAQQRADWECVRRYGRSAQIYLTTDSWRDASGALWAPNALVDVDLPTLHATNKRWLITEVTYKRGRDGTSADLLIMPAAAFVPEPTLLQPITPDTPANAAQGPKQ